MLGAKEVKRSREGRQPCPVKVAGSRRKVPHPPIECSVAFEGNWRVRGNCPPSFGGTFPRVRRRVRRSGLIVLRLLRFAPADRAKVREKAIE